MIFHVKLPPLYHFYSLYKFPAFYRVGLHKDVVPPQYLHGKRLQIYGHGFGDSPTAALLAAIADIEKQERQREPAPSIDIRINL